MSTPAACPADQTAPGRPGLQNLKNPAILFLLMKTEIHPTYFKNAKVTCSCGNTFTTGATQAVIHVEICAKCHPFYTGKQKIVDTAGRVERFRQKYSKKAA